MRRYDESVEVRRADAEPEQFLWRGRLWKVRAVLAHWVEAGSRLGGEPLVAVPDDPAGPAGLEHWRVRAGRGGVDADGVFDLALDRVDGTWQLVGRQG